MTMTNCFICLCVSLRVRECEISPSLDVSTLLCGKGISCVRLKGRDTGTVLFEAELWGTT